MAEMRRAASAAASTAGTALPMAAFSDTPPQDPIQTERHVPERIFLSPPHMGGTEQAYVTEAFQSNYIAPVGPHITALESRFASWLGSGHCTALSSGTAALHLALRMAGVGPGDLVLCSDLTFIASVTPVLFQGAEPVFVDADPDTWNMDPALAAEAMDELAAKGRAPKAVIAVHLYGQSTDLDPLRRACAKHGSELIEDAAESLGATYKDRPTGTLTRFGAFSFNGNKIITAAGGGLLWCRDKADADQARFLATQARDAAPHYEHTTFGYNYRMSNVQAAIGLGQLEVLGARVARKRAIEADYRKRLADVSTAHGPLAFMPEAPFGRSNRWLTCVLFPGPADRAEAMRERVRLALEAENIESRPLWKPMHMQPLFRDMGSRCFGGAVGADLFARGLCLPCGTSLSEADMDRVCAVLRKAVEG